MRLNKVKSKNAISYYIIRSVRRGGKNSSEIVKKLGTEKSIRETYGVDDVDAWGRTVCAYTVEVVDAFGTGGSIGADGVDAVWI